MDRNERLDKFLTADLKHETGRDDVRRRLTDVIIGNPNEKTVAPHRPRVFLAVASLALCIVAVVAVLMIAPGRTEYIRVATSSGQTDTVELPDGSRLWLNECSEVFFPSRFSRGERKIFATGEIYADVAKDNKSEFVIEADRMKIIVHGTKFNFKSRLDDDIREVSLDEGSLGASFDGGEVMEIRSGELLRYSGGDKTVEKYGFTSGRYATWRENENYVILNMKFSDVVSDLERRYGSRIIIMNSGLEDMRFYASFINGESLREILSALNTNGKMKIEYTDNTVLIY